MDNATEFAPFHDLKQRQKPFEEQLTTLLNTLSAIEYPNPLPQKRKETPEETIKALCDKSKRQKESQKQLVRDHKECTEEIEALESRIGDLTVKLQNLQQKIARSTCQSKEASKPLVKAIKKYSTNLGMEVEVKDLDGDQFVAFVRFSGKEEEPQVQFVIDRKRRCIADFRASSLMSDEEAEELKARATTANGLKTSILLKAIRKLCI